MNEEEAAQNVGSTLDRVTVVKEPLESFPINFQSLKDPLIDSSLTQRIQLWAQVREIIGVIEVLCICLQNPFLKGLDLLLVLQPQLYQILNHR